MKRRFRLTRSSDFKRVRSLGKSFAHPLIVLIAQPSQHIDTRVAVVAGVIVGGAVVRNRIKRRLRACIAEFLPRLQPGWDLILIARKPSAQASFQEIRQAVMKVLEQSGVVSKQVECD